MQKESLSNTLSSLCMFACKKAGGGRGKGIGGGGFLPEGSLAPPSPLCSRAFSYMRRKSDLTEERPLLGLTLEGVKERKVRPDRGEALGRSDFGGCVGEESQT